MFLFVFIPIRMKRGFYFDELFRKAPPSRFLCQGRLLGNLGNAWGNTLPRNYGADALTGWRKWFQEWERECVRGRHLNANSRVGGAGPRKDLS